MKKKMVGDVPGNVLGMLADLMHKLQKGVITPEQLGKFLKKKNPFVGEDYSEIIAGWQAFYRKHFGLDLDFSSVVIPEKPEGKYRLLIIADIGLETLYAKCKELFPVWRWTTDDLDKIVVENERDTKNGAYAIWVKDTQEADEDLKNLSANDIKKMSVATETLAERLIHELKLFDETGKHLDVKNVTLCAGSRYVDSAVPFVFWDGGKMKVHWYGPGFASDSLRSRSAVSL